MPLYLPNEGWLVRFDLDDEALEELNETLQKHAWNVIMEDGLLAFDLKAPVERFRSRPDFVSAEKAWCFTSEDTHEAGCRFHGEYSYPSVRVVDRACIATDREDALAALGETYPPVHLLLHVWHEEGGDVKRIARAPLDGDDRAFGVLCDALADAGHPLAGLAARIASEWLNLPMHGDGLPVIIPWKGYLRDLGLSADGSLAYTQDGGKVRVLTAKDGKGTRGGKREVPLLAGGGEAAFSSAAGIVVKAVGGRTTAFAVHPWREVWSREMPGGGRMETSPDGSRFAARCDDYVIRVWLTATGEEVGSFKVGKTHATLHGFTADGRLALRSEQGRLALWAPGRRVVWEDLAAGHDDNWFHIHPAGDRAAVHTRGRRVGVRVLATGELLNGLFDHNSHRFVGFSADGRLFVTEQDQRLTAHDGRTGAVLARINARKDLNTVALAADGSAVAGWGHHRGLRVWPLARRSPDPVPFEVDFRIDGVAIAPDASRFVAAQPAPMSLVEMDAGGVAITQVSSFTGVTAAAYSPDGKALAAARAGLVSLRSGKRQRVGIEVGTSPVRALRFSPDGRRVAAAFASGEAAIYRVSDGERVWCETPHEGGCNAVAFSGAEACSGGAGGTVCVGGKPSLDAGAPVAALDVSSSGLVAAVAGRRVVLSDGEPITSLLPCSVRFVSADVLAVGCWGEVVLLRLPSREVLHRIPAGPGEVMSLDWAPAGRVLAMGCQDRHVRLCTIPPG